MSKVTVTLNKPHKHRGELHEKGAKLTVAPHIAERLEKRNIVGAVGSNSLPSAKKGAEQKADDAGGEQS